MSNEPAYQVERDEPGCPTCASGRSYRVLWSANLSMVRGKMSHIEASILCDLLNDAYVRGQATKQEQQS